MVEVCYIPQRMQVRFWSNYNQFRPFSRPEFRDNVPNSGHLAKMSLFCPEFRVFWAKNRDISDFHTVLYHLSPFFSNLVSICPDFVPIF